MNLTIKNFKPAYGLSDETLAFSATIYADGKRAGTVENHGQGGCNFYHWTDRTLGKGVEAWADQQKTEFDFERLDQIIDKLIVAEEQRRENKKLARTTKKKTLFRIKGDDETFWRTLSVPYGPKAQKWLEENYKGRVVAIYGKEG